MRRSVLNLARRVARRSVGTTVLDAAGVAAVTAGVAQIYVPAAYIVAGAAVLAWSWALESGGGE